MALVSALASTGCFSSMTIPLAEAQRWNNGGAARSSEGDDVEVASLSGIEPVAPSGSQYALGEDGVTLVPEGVGYRPANLSVSGPLRVHVDDVVRLSGPRRSVALDRRAVSALRARRYSPSQTAGLAIGLTLGTLAAAIGATAAVLHSASFGSSWGSFGD